jgi:prepilin-type N-terminal cleavage/methylation domain-containing protein
VFIRFMRYKKFRKVNQGFTILELLTVFAVMGILASVALPSYSNYINKSRVGATLEYMSGLISQTTTELQTSENFNGTTPIQSPMEFLQCVTYEVYQNSQRECTEVFLSAWPDNEFFIEAKPGKTRMLVFHGSLDSTSGSVSWNCGPYANRTKNIDNSLLPSSCMAEIPKPRGRRCISARLKKDNRRCTRGKL